jgi:hypothetical protein
MPLSGITIQKEKVFHRKVEKAKIIDDLFQTIKMYPFFLNVHQKIFLKTIASLF